MTTTHTSGAADLLTLIEAYAEARHRQGHSSYNAQTAAALQAVKDALAVGQATAAKPAAPPNAIIASVVRDDGGEAPAFCLMAAYRSEKDAMDALALIAAALARPAPASLLGLMDKR